MKEALSRTLKDEQDLSGQGRDRQSGQEAEKHKVCSENND